MKNSSKLSLIALIILVCYALVSCGAFVPEGEESLPVGVGGNVQQVTDSEQGEAGNGSSDEVTDGPTFSDVTEYETVASDVEMESNIDNFTLSEVTYGVDEKFVYTATVSFERGIAAGLAFGSEAGSHFWVFNVDRDANLVKLLYFTVNQDGSTSVSTLFIYNVFT